MGAKNHSVIEPLANIPFLNYFAGMAVLGSITPVGTGLNGSTPIPTLGSDTLVYSVTMSNTCLSHYATVQTGRPCKQSRYVLFITLGSNRYNQTCPGTLGGTQKEDVEREDVPSYRVKQKKPPLWSTYLNYVNSGEPSSEPSHATAAAHP